MNRQHYPGLYQAADEVSGDAQHYYLWTVRAYLLSLAASTAFALFSGTSTTAALVAAFLFLLSLGLALLLALKRFEKTWYSARAVAESVKTLTWRYIMRATPYRDGGKKDPKCRFIRDLREILKENRDTTKELCTESATTEAVTEEMERVRALPLNERVQIYKTERVDEQHFWYNTKAIANRRLHWIWFGVMIAFQIFALVCVLLRVAKPTWDKLPTDFLAVVAGAVLTWIQTKRYSELSTSYSLTTHEISMIAAQFTDFVSEESFSDFVGDSENAFSREHTQWIARRDA